MPASPVMRYSPGREPRTDGHKRGRSLEGGLLLREKDDDLALFSEMQTRERENFLLQSSDDLEDSFPTKLRHFSDVNLGISIPGRGQTSDLLNADGDKNDYDWLLTPPDTPLFPSLDDEQPPLNIPSRGRPQSKPISISRSSTMEKSYRSSRGSASPNRASPNRASPNRLSPSPRSGANTLQSRGRPSSLPNSSPTPISQYGTPSRRPSPPPNKPMTPPSRSSITTPRRMSTGSSGHVVSSGKRGNSPVKTNRGNSASPKIRAWQTNIPGFSSEAPPNLRTSLADRPSSYVRGSSPASRNGRGSSPASRNGRGSSPASRNGRGSSPAFSRQSMSPTASRSSSSFYSHDRDQFSSLSKGSVASSGDDDLDSLQSIPVGSLDTLDSRKAGSFSTNRTPTFSKKSARIVSPNSAPKRSSFDSAFRQMDRKSPQNMFRPLLSSVPSTTFYVGKGNSAQRSLVSRNSSVTTSSNASSDQGTGFALDIEGSDHNQDDMASETDKILYPDIHEEVFAFDKIDKLNANVEHQTNTEAIDVVHNETRGLKVLGSTVSPEPVYHGGIDIVVNEGSESSLLMGDNSETGSFENTAICSHCGCSYEAADEVEKNIGICPECRKKTTVLKAIILETALTVPEDSSGISRNRPEEEASATTSSSNVTSKLPQETDVVNLRFPHGEQEAEESQTSCSELIQDHSQSRSLVGSLTEVDGQVSTTPLEMNQSEVDCKPHEEFGDQQLNNSERPNLKVDFTEGAGISVLLKRSNSHKGTVIQGRSFSASRISYDDLSFSRDSVTSIRSSTRQGSCSASSSVDFSSTRQTEFRGQRQLSSRKLDVDCGYDLRIKAPSAGSSFSGTSNHSHHGLDLATHDNYRKTECRSVEDTSQVLQERLASENAVTDVIDASSIRSIVEENKFEIDDGGRVNSASESLSQTAGVQSEDNSVASFPNIRDCISHENVEDHQDTERSVPNTETLVKVSESSFDEKEDVQDAFLATNSSTITETEIEGNSENNTGTVNEDLSQLSKSFPDEFQEPRAQNPSDDCVTASVSEMNASDYSHGIEGSTVTVECQGPGNTRSLTLEEATDTILFCSSIVHDLAYQAATMAMEKEFSDPFEGSEPTVTVLGKPNSDRKETRSRTIGKRSMKSHKAAARQRKLESDVKPPPGKITENDENINEPFMRNVGIPNEVDSTKPPPKLESKCNCIIM
ncbi:hypothetical protein HN51_058204 [Arachis hypogaea]|uniref:uncharacterized protein LOC107622673 n=1 Tax=Arachis ipaensis TaxID=130454 RepID=UPI0007AF762B|nr:uncharacterized protein LOC107622673 [Arachis ipaensis]XP_025683705.1 uncharacterized protein LOC112784638 isoform X1 [Arachis hypogaea]XP_025683706.1 uncharacterized protein LOC112784638 isoform X1 [Arachis hypogaea]XP_025683707.1 uncharacterized protein LOC112784638 isoform X1 [Arachis hypogaea]QHN81410.1 uncharacterized protein DS421_20g686640 [Arachis hypogaea]QHN81411.1 uncharacterized protein DS421_20g686640 [Arachis hypogaea]